MKTHYSLDNASNLKYVDNLLSKTIITFIAIFNQTFHFPMTNITIAVLPFINMSADPDNEYFSDGITEEIINALAAIANLKVISRRSSFYFKDKNIPVREIARQLNVSTLLEGSVRVAQGMVRITTQLIQAEEDFHFWSQTWDRKLENIFEIQDEISLLIADKIREQFGHFEIREHLVEPQTINVDAYTYSLKARYHFNRWNPEDVKLAIELYENAIKIDPNHTDSFVGLADAYGFMATTQFMPMEQAWAKAAAYTQKALVLDPENAGVHYQLANLAFFTDCDFKSAAHHAFKALECKANYPEAQQFLSFLYMLSGQMEKAGRHLQLALAIDPLNEETLFYKAYYHYRTDQFAEALQQFNSSLEKNPKNLPAIIVRSYCQLMLGQFDEVLEVLDGLPEEMIIPEEQLGLRCLTYIMMGDSEHSDEYLKKLKHIAKNPTSFQAHTYLFLAYIHRGSQEKAFKWLEKTLKLKSSIFLLSYSDPLAGAIFQDPLYQKFHSQLYPPLGKDEPDRNKKAPLLDHNSAEILSQKLLDFIDDEKSYLNPNLNLRSLAEMVEIHPNQLSWLLNEKMGRNFNEFINSYRLEHFKLLACDQANKHISLIGLAYESGFNSKTVFNTFFKKEVGMTPSQFLKSVSGSNTA